MTDMEKVDKRKGVEWLMGLAEKKGADYVQWVMLVAQQRAEFLRTRDKTVALKLAVQLGLHSIGECEGDVEKAEVYANAVLDDADVLLKLGTQALHEYYRKFGGPLSQEDGVSFGGTD